MASEDRVLGRIGITLKGEYDNNKTYTKLNQVTYKGSSYTLKVAEATGILPTNSDYWICSAKKGDKGDKGDTGDIGPIGPKPVNGIDYNTDAEKEEFKNAVVADSKADLEKYITEKETHLDNYTKEKETKLDDYVTDTVKPVIDTYVTDTTKKDIDAYEKKKETALDTYTDTKKTEIDNYVTNTSKPALDQYEKDKETELETAKNTAISEYDAHAESVLTETNDLFNALDTEKISGTELYIEDAKPCRIMNTEIGGMYKQNQTKGLNFFDITGYTDRTVNGINIKVNDDGTLTLNGVCTVEKTFVNISIPEHIIPAGTYTRYMSYAENIKSFLTLVLSYNNTTIPNTSVQPNNQYTTSTYNDDITYNQIKLYIPNTNVTFNNIIVDPMFVRGEYTANNAPKYEPYTGEIPSPNPNYQQKIEQVESVKLNINNKNLLNPIFTVNSNCTIENQTITSTVLLAQTVQFIRFGFPKIKLRKGIKYYISFRAKKINTNYTGGFNQVQLFTANNKKFINFSAIVNPNLNANYQRYNFVSANITEEQSLLDYVKILVQRKNIAEDLVFAITDVMVTKENTEYTAYQNQTINIDLKGNKLCAVSDTIKDKLLIDRSGNVALQKNVNYSTFSAFNSINGSFTKSTQFILNISNCVKNVEQNSFNALSNCMLKNTTDGGMGFYGTTTSGNVRITVLNSLLNVTQEDTTSTKLNAAKTFLQNLQQTPEIYYPAEVPELIDLGQLPELLKTFNGINNVWAETNLGNTEIEIEYVQDVKKLLEKQAEQQNARLDNIEALLSTTETSALLLDNMQNDLEKEVE